MTYIVLTQNYNIWCNCFARQNFGGQNQWILMISSRVVFLGTGTTHTYYACFVQAEHFWNLPRVTLGSFLAFRLGQNRPFSYDLSRLWKNTPWTKSLDLYAFVTEKVVFPNSSFNAWGHKYTRFALPQPCHAGSLGFAPDCKTLHPTVRLCTRL